MLPHNPHLTQRGFSLLEILVAFSILALSLGILLKIFSSGVHSASLSEEYTTAVQIAEGLMAKTGVEEKLKPGRFVGEFDDKYRWEINVSPFEFITGKFKLNTTAELFRVEVSVNWGDDDDDNREVFLTTLKLANKPV